MGKLVVSGSLCVIETRSHVCTAIAFTFNAFTIRDTDACVNVFETFAITVMVNSELFFVRVDHFELWMCSCIKKGKLLMAAWYLWVTFLIGLLQLNACLTKRYNFSRGCSLVSCEEHVTHLLLNVALPPRNKTLFLMHEVCIYSDVSEEYAVIETRVACWGTNVALVSIEFVLWISFLLKRVFTSCINCLVTFHLSGAAIEGYV